MRELLGTGNPLREFLHVDDLGEACVFVLENWQPDFEDPPFLNVGTGVDSPFVSCRKWFLSSRAFKEKSFGTTATNRHP